MAKFTRRCGHTHVSGRQCAAQVGRDAYGDIQIYCGLHKTEDCRDCQSMMQQFKPPKGWAHG